MLFAVLTCRIELWLETAQVTTVMRTCYRDERWSYANHHVRKIHL